MEKLRGVGDLKNLRELLKDELFIKDALRVRVCCGTACTASGSKKVVGAFNEEASRRGIDIEVVKTGCQGLCQKGPVMMIEPQGLFYQRVKAGNVHNLVSYTMIGGMPFREHLYRHDIYSEPVEYIADIPENIFSMAE